MAYSIGPKTVINNDTTTEFNKLSLSLAPSDYLEIAPPPPPPVHAGSVAGFTSGGQQTPSTPTRQNDIYKFPFAISSGTATNVGDATPSNPGAAAYSQGASTPSDGFTHGGFTPAVTNTINKWPFSAPAVTSTDVGNLAISVAALSPASQQSETEAFTSGGRRPSTTNLLTKYPFAISSGTGSSTGNLTASRYGVINASSSTDGFASGGYPGPAPAATRVINKFPFSITSGTIATDVGDLANGGFNGAGHSSDTDGFVSSRWEFPGPGSNLSQIDKFPFTISSGTATDVGDLSYSARESAGLQSGTDGYSCGGIIVPSTTSEISKFPFSISSGTGTDVGDLTTTLSGCAAHQD